MIAASKEQLLEMVQKREVPEACTEALLKNWQLRNKVVAWMGFVLVTKNWVRSLASWIDDRKCLEIMAGCGCLSYALQQEGVAVIPTDDFSWEDRWASANHLWTDVYKIDAIKAIKLYGRNVDFIIMAFPYMDELAAKCLKTMRKVAPDCQMIYIGEEDGGCTADDDFFEVANFIEDIEFNEAVREFKSWRFMYDRPYLVR